MDFKIIAITKSEGSISKDFISKIEGQKSRLIVVKTSKIVKCDSKIGTSLFNKISMLSSGYIIFLSPNAVNIFLKIALDLNQINEVVDNINSKFSVIAIGPSTRNILIQNKIIVDYMPEDNSSFGMIDLLSKLNNNNNNNNNLKIIIPRSLLGDKYLKTKLEELGFDVYDFHIYSVEPAEIDDSWLEFLDLLKKGKIDSLIFTSPSNVRFLVNILRNYSSELLPLIYKIKLILSIGPLTSKELVKYNIISFVESKNHSLDGIYNTLYCNNKI
jgi:uroporphyrinogen III methyltransferase/synthase